MRDVAALKAELAERGAATALGFEPGGDTVARIKELAAAHRPCRSKAGSR